MGDLEHKEKALTYRPEIDGLRGIAVLAVVLYHCGFQWTGFPIFSGGFLGVDIFFVISGFLISSILLRELDRDQFSYWYFIERRARRILPALLALFFVALFSSLFLTTAKAFVEFSGSLKWATLMISNFWFLAENNYFAQASDLKPLLHTWSLAIEEQFYLFFPPFLFCGFRYFRKYIFSTTLVLFFLSFFSAIQLSSGSPDLAFYAPYTRAWELLLGVLGSFLFLKNQKRFHFGKFNDGVNGLSLIAILLSFLFFDHSNQHPAYITLIPCLATFLILLSYSQKSKLSLILCHPLLLFIGLISYSFYLWHWLGLALLRNQVPHPNLTATILVICASLVLSFISYRFVETPFRSKKRVSRGLLIRTLGLGFSALLVFTLISENLARQELLTYPENKKIHQFSEQPKKYGKGPTKFILYGDSMAQMLVGEFEKQALDGGFSFFAITHMSCLSLPDLTSFYPRHKSGAPRESCVGLHRHLSQLINQKDLPILFAIFWNKTLSPVHKHMEDLPLTNIDGTANQTGLKRYTKSLRTFKSRLNSKSTWYILGNIPGTAYQDKMGYLGCIQQFWFPKALAKNWGDSQNFNEVFCKKLLPEDQGEFFQGNQWLAQSLSKNTDIKFINPYPLFCEEQQCPSEIEGKSLYIDHHHLSDLGAKILVNELFNLLNN